MTGRNEHFYGVLCVVIASCFWGTTGAMASLLPEVSSFTIGSLTTGFGGVLMALFSMKILKADSKILKANYKVLLIGSVSVAIYPLAFYTAMRFSGIAIGTLISIASAPFFTVLLERFISKKPISLQWSISFLIGVCGVVLLSSGKQGAVTTESVADLHGWGIALGLVAGLTYAIYSWSGRQLIEQGVNSRSSMASMFGIAALLLIPPVIFRDPSVFFEIKPVLVFTYLSVIPMFIGYLCFGYGLKTLDASTATLITLLEPAVAMLLAITLLGEMFNSVGWFGMLLIVLCLALQAVKVPFLQPRAALLP